MNIILSPSLVQSQIGFRLISNYFFTNSKIGQVASTALAGIVVASALIYGRSRFTAARARESEIEVLNKVRLKNFKEELEETGGVCYEGDSQQIAEMLFASLPENVKPQEVINLIFEQCRQKKIPQILDAILYQYPSFTLSPLDQVRRTIAEDTYHRLTNDSIRCMLSEHRLDGDEKSIAACYDLAYRVKHPNIYRLSKTPVLQSDYSLNFLWVNLNPQDRIKDVAQNIFNDGLDVFENAECIKYPASPPEGEGSWQIKRSFMYRISKWADENPGAQINLWYDSALVTQKAAQNTFEMLRAISQFRGVGLKLRDIRRLPKIEGEIENALHPGTPVYFRVDFLKALIADHMIDPSQNIPRYCVVSDIDVEPMPPEQIFDQRTMEYLSSAGYVFYVEGPKFSGIENSFFIFDKQKADLQRIHYETIIGNVESNIALHRPYPRGKDAPGDPEAECSRHLNYNTVFKYYIKFIRAMNEKSNREPRKVVKCPPSQFADGKREKIPKSDPRSETFHFVGDSRIPLTRYGRNIRKYIEDEIDELKDWKAEPLDLVEA